MSKRYRIVQCSPEKFSIQRKGWFFWNYYLDGTGEHAQPLTFDTFNEAKQTLTEIANIENFKPRVVAEYEY